MTDIDFNSIQLPDSISLPFVEELYEKYLEDPLRVPPEWRVYFDQWTGQKSSTQPIPAMVSDTHLKLGPNFASARSNDNSDGAYGVPTQPAPMDTAGTSRMDIAVTQDRVNQLIRNYRVRGHLVAKVNPLDLPVPSMPEIQPSYYGFTESDLDREFVHNGRIMTLREMVGSLHNTYCRSIGVQFMHIDDLQVREWLQSRIETTENRLELSRREQMRIFARLTDAVIFEQFIQKKYVGAKRFSLEGGESLIPLLDMAIERAADQGVSDIILGMAHRGRLNVLANIMGKSPTQIFMEFEDKNPEKFFGRGDVKYHKGYTNRWISSNGRTVHMSLCFNPSHLEFVNPVANGRVRARQDRKGDTDRSKLMSIVIHGDAAFAGEGIVQETLNMSELEGYRTGGTLHVVVNNQIGFTTSPLEGRSSVYATDVAKMLQIPIFHVNGEDPEAVGQVVKLAMDFRREYQRDVVIDMYCYRVHGHNEGDEPDFTHPLLYRKIRQKQTVMTDYYDRLVRLKGLTPEELTQIGDERKEWLERQLTEARSDNPTLEPEAPLGSWRDYYGGPERTDDLPDTFIPRERAEKLLTDLTKVPETFTKHRKIDRWMKIREEMAKGNRPLDWAAGEALAYASIATDGYPVRLSGQDAERGTFSHRHGVLFDYQTGQSYCPLDNLSPDQGHVELINSPLCESGVLGFEYGYSLDASKTLVIWEAQFGDFANTAQVIIDQFISSGEDKWNRMCGLVMLLPHGFEGQGPEHSSARLERFLELCAEDNMQVVEPTTPAQLFHLLRRQMIRKWRKPLIIMSPKSLLRHPKVVSPLEDFTEGRFKRIIPDPLFTGEELAKAKRILLCCGKVFYDLEAYREEHEIKDVAILRLEQLYPLKVDYLKKHLGAATDETPLVWVQEEPRNMGGWRYLLDSFGPKLFDKLPLHCVSRKASASPATGSGASHKLEQKQLIERAFGIES